MSQGVFVQDVKSPGEKCPEGKRLGGKCPGDTFHGIYIS